MTPSFLSPLILFALLAAGVAHAQPANNPFRADLIAGRTDPSTQKKIGELLVWNDASNLYVQFKVENAVPVDPANSWCLNATNLEVATKLSQIPTQEGAPEPGQFHYHTDLNCVGDQTYTIPVTWPKGTSLFIAASVDVMKQGGLDALKALIPDDATIQVKRDDATAKSYFEATVTGGGILNGVHDTWCLEPDGHIQQGDTYTAKAYSSYESLPAGTIAHPEKSSFVNWIVNQKYVDSSSPGGFGKYTYGDVQRAIWTFVSDKQTEAGLGDWKQERVDEIVAAALLHGGDFVPACEQNVGVILVPVDAGGAKKAQVVVSIVTLLNLNIPCASASAQLWVGSYKFPCLEKVCKENDAYYLGYKID